MGVYSFSTLTADTIAILKQLSKPDCEKAITILNERVQSIQLYQDYQSIELFDLPLSIRAFNGLKTNGLSTVGDVLLYGLDNIWKLRFIGPKSEKEIKTLFTKILERKDALFGLSRETLEQMLKA